MLSVYSPEPEEHVDYSVSSPTEIIGLLVNPTWEKWKYGLNEKDWV